MKKGELTEAEAKARWMEASRKVGAMGEGGGRAKANAKAKGTREP